MAPLFLQCFFGEIETPTTTVTKAAATTTNLKSKLNMENNTKFSEHGKKRGGAASNGLKTARSNELGRREFLYWLSV